MKKSTNPLLYQHLLVQKPDNPVDAFEANVYACKEASGYTWQEIADATGVPLDGLKRISMRSNSDYKMSTLLRLAAFFHLSADELAGTATISEQTIKSIQMLRKLDPSYREFFRSVIQWVHDYLLVHKPIKKSVPVMEPPCNGSGNLVYSMRNIRSPLDISDIEESLIPKIIQAVRVPCDHYMPYYCKGDYLLLAKDRAPLPDEVLVVVVSGCLWFGIQKSDGYLYSIVDGHRCGKLSEVDQILGYVALVYSLNIE